MGRVVEVAVTEAKVPAPFAAVREEPAGVAEEHVLFEHEERHELDRADRFLPSEGRGGEVPAAADCSHVLRGIDGGLDPRSPGRSRGGRSGGRLASGRLFLPLRPFRVVLGERGAAPVEAIQPLTQVPSSAAVIRRRRGDRQELPESERRRVRRRTSRFQRHRPKHVQIPF